MSVAKVLSALVLPVVLLVVATMVLFAIAHSFAINNAQAVGLFVGLLSALGLVCTSLRGPHVR
jgi:hypothetical protein